MRVEYINPFVESAAYVLREVASLEVVRGTPTLKSSVFPAPPITVLLGMVGDVKGQVIYGMGRETGLALVSRMMMGASVTEFDEVARSAIGEVGNMVTGMAATKLEKLGAKVSISPPTVIMGNQMEISAIKTKVIVVPLETELGLIEINIGVETAI